MSVTCAMHFCSSSVPALTISCNINYAASTLTLTMAAADAKPILIGKDGVPMHLSLSKAKFPTAAFEGKWFVVQSMLGMWKMRKDVTIMYTPHTLPPHLAYNDHVQYWSSSVPLSQTLSSVVGISTLLPMPGAGADNRPTVVSKHGPHFKWQGLGLLVIASSKWQVLGYDMDKGWVVTFFKKMLLTPTRLSPPAAWQCGWACWRCRICLLLWGPST
ncbi:hypothetical protein CALCODRAFT_511491 [Calocera cornea HHB12733]|uniref:Uncharacterized protein n=1 Tax=Calocera cornea HHB12733 TaxID=1353952 RepID=A0A165DR13_9BASI|nr:hypothetical protein CALCODRAFT_511491 [Calocera cornea HHB12733]